MPENIAGEHSGKMKFPDFSKDWCAKPATNTSFPTVGGLRPGPLRSVTDRAPEFDDRSSLQKDASPLGTSPCGLFSFRVVYPYGAFEKNYPINAGKIGINNTLGCCFNLSRHKAVERVVDDLKLSRLGSYNQLGLSVRLPLPRFDASSMSHTAISDTGSSHVGDDDRQIDRYSYDDDIVRWFVFATIFWGLVATSVGVIVAALLVSP